LDVLAGALRLAVDRVLDPEPPLAGGFNLTTSPMAIDCTYCYVIP
jgi:hypothetical protein